MSPFPSALLSIPSPLVYGFDKVKAALLTYKALFGHLLVSDMYVVPKDSGWSEDLWGMKLGEWLRE